MTFKLALVLAILQLGLSMPDPDPKKEHVKITNTNVVDIEMPESGCCVENICMLQMDHGYCPVEPCPHFKRFYFNVNLQWCQPFTYKGSRGLGNRFSTFEECRMKCGPLLETTTTATTVPTTSTAKTCGSVQELENGIVIGDNPPNPINTTVTFKCDSGYKLDADIKTICLENETWSLDTPKCIYCPGDHFIAVGSSQCYKFLNDTMRTWQEGVDKCEELHLTLANPYNALAVTTYLGKTYDLDAWTWIGGKGNGTHMIWHYNGEVILHTNSWYGPYNPLIGNRLILLTNSDNVERGTTHFSSSQILNQRWILCELVNRK